MTSPTCRWISLRPFFFSSLVMVCFLAVFFTYYKADIKSSTLCIHKERSNYSCPVVACPERAQTRESSPNCSTELLINQQPDAAQEIKAAAANTEPDTILLIWIWPFGSNFKHSCSIFNVQKCHLTGDRTLYNKAHGVLFHHRDIHGGMPTEPRPWFQKWVWLNMESPAHSSQIPQINNLFNLTCNYRRDSSIHVPYGYLAPVTPEDESFKLPTKDKLVCWIVSNWNPQFKRVEFYNEMKKHIEIHTFGDAFGHHVNEQDFLKIVASCKFYFSFENSVHKDYFTEKLFRSLMAGTVPVVLGPPRENYENSIPGDSFIHVNDFSTPKELADRLLYLDKSNPEYMSYFKWTNRFKVQRTWFGFEHACRTCSYLQTHKEYEAFRDLNKWYWG